MKASARKRIQRLLDKPGKSRKIKSLAKKFEQNSTLSKRDMKILEGLVGDAHLPPGG